MTRIAAARTFGVTDAEIAAAREGTSPDPAVAAMIATGLAIYSKPTTITDAQVAELHAFGAAGPPPNDSPPWGLGNNPRI